jgi:hypothetical protein
MKSAAIITLGVASALLASAIAMAEHWRLGTWEIPSWEEDGHFIETTNGHFEVELTQSQYREVMRKHQAPFLPGIVAIATIPVSLALVSLIVSRRRKARVTQLNR